MDLREQQHSYEVENGQLGFSIIVDYPANSSDSLLFFLLVTWSVSPSAQEIKCLKHP